MLDSPVSRAAALYTFPAVLALSAMSIITKYIAVQAHSLGQGLTYYLTVSTFVSGLYNLLLYKYQTSKPASSPSVVSRKMLRAGSVLVAFSSLLIIAKTMALRIAPNPGYVTALLLIAPVFVYALNRNYKISDTISLKSGFAMMFFLALLVLTVNGNYGVSE